MRFFKYLENFTRFSNRFVHIIFISYYKSGANAKSATIAGDFLQNIP